MAAPSVRNVAAAKPQVGGGIWYAPIGTALPVDCTTALIAAYKPLGYIGEEGLVPSPETSIEKQRAWGGDVVAALLANDAKSFAYTLLEVFQQDVNNFVYGTANVTLTPPAAGQGTKLTILEKGVKPAQCVKVFDMFHNAKRMRFVLPVCDPVVTGELPYVDSAISGYEITSEALKDSSGNRIYRYLQNDDGL